MSLEWAKHTWGPLIGKECDEAELASIPYPMAELTVHVTQRTANVCCAVDARKVAQLASRLPRARAGGLRARRAPLARASHLAQLDAR